MGVMGVVGEMILVVDISAIFSVFFLEGVLVKTCL